MRERSISRLIMKLLPRRNLGYFNLLAPMIAYVLLVRGFKGYWLENDLRHLYKEILKPYYRRVDDTLCDDYRDLRDELARNKVNPEKSMAIKMRQSVEQKVIRSKSHSETREEIANMFGVQELSDERVNVNLIKRL